MSPEAGRQANTANVAMAIGGAVLAGTAVWLSTREEDCGVEFPARGSLCNLGSDEGELIITTAAVGLLIGALVGFVRNAAVNPDPKAGSGRRGIDGQLPPVPTAP